ncbi:16S rRNA (guanine(966)-N(2))-methyltransferase RsmD [Candidatus Pseudomonas adelgestsugas]|uniref:Ribosomal RNA small subunit methyltransferase D n=1 Tax=Candidatus Pseudomonas adelgestsugas TaxID=1302376 RepID=A0ABX5R8E0_9PSED|nr:16S rRNA (guanine(966)-N(2))-methyltransferase RsmD [Candidatus Pseudomonas adelgestsugas]QAX81450.1 Ribosomal RNA small subunit methyltransferase D [Candidatus Pseudomonas adelgestsugas]
MTSLFRQKKFIHNIHRSMGQLRIIGGEWSNFKLSLPDVVDLRPTLNNVRETLFNWLAPYISGAKVLDPFTGSGALFLEALSRGAAHGLSLDTSNIAVSKLKEHLRTLHCTTGEVQTVDALRYLEIQATNRYDIVFLDPPFNQNLLPTVCALLEKRQWLAVDAWIYTESGSSLSTVSLPSSWRLHREHKSGRVYYALWHRFVEGTV